MSSLSENKKWKYDFRKKNKKLEKSISHSRLYLEHFNLKKPPFTITPDPEFIYSSSTHRTAIENILYGIEACMGFILLTGEVGTGKTTICRTILDKLEDRAETVYIVNPSLSGIEIIQAVLDDLGIAHPADASKKILLDHLNSFLLEVTPHKPVVIIIDDAQTMTTDGLENLRLLSNLETDKKKLLQLVLAGQPELHELLARTELRQLKQRIAICCHLDLISRTELRQYISLRLFVSGNNGQITVAEGAINKIYKASHGIPRLINTICDYALTAGYVSNSLFIKKTHVEKAISELRYQSLIDKSFLSEISSCISGKRILVVLLILISGLSVFTYTYKGKLFEKKSVLSWAGLKQEVSLDAVYHDADHSGHVAVTDNSTPPGKRKDTAVGLKKMSSIEAIENAHVKKNSNFILQIASLHTLKAAIQEGADWRQRGVDVHWNAVHLIEKGTWYRIYKDGFSTAKEAVLYAKENDLKGAIVIYAPWTVCVTSAENVKTPEDIYSVLQANGYDCNLEESGDTGYRVTSGAFINSERAQKIAQEILGLGLNAKPELR